MLNATHTKPGEDVNTEAALVIADFCLAKMGRRRVEDKRELSLSHE